MVTVVEPRQGAKDLLSEKPHRVHDEKVCEGVTSMDNRKKIGMERGEKKKDLVCAEL